MKIWVTVFLYILTSMEFLVFFFCSGGSDGLQ